MISRLLVVFGDPDSENVPGYLTEVAKSIEGFSQDVKDDACTYLMKTHKSQRFPTPALCRAACEHVVHERGQAAPREPGKLDHADWTKHAIAKADALIVSDIGRRAADAGWVLALHDFCRKRGRLPLPHEIDKLRQSARGFDDAYGSLDGHPRAGVLRKLADSMLARRDKYARMAHGEIVE